MTRDSTILYEVRRGITWVTLNRPAVLNAINLQMRDELWGALDVIEADEEVGVVIFRGATSLTGTGGKTAESRAFSAGADISEFGTAPSYIEARRARLARDLWGRLSHFPKPLIAAVHGYALGAGCELSLLCDFRIASEDARFGLPETHLGYVPTAGGSQTLPRTIGRGRALDMILSAEAIDAARALDYGLLQQVVPLAQLYATAEALGRRLLSQPKQALLLAKRALVEGAELPIEAAIRLEASLRTRLVTG